MTTPIWVLLGFATWTLLILFGSVGVYRWHRVLTGRREVKSFRADDVTGADWYKRAMRAHANCIENLPIYGAIVIALLATGIESRAIDILAIVMLAARVPHSLVHICFEQTNVMASLRFVFYVVQPLCMLAMIGLLVSRVM